MNGGGGSSAVRRAKTFSLGAQVVIIVPVVRIYHPHFLQIFCSSMIGNFHTREAECRIDENEQKDPKTKGFREIEIAIHLILREPSFIQMVNYSIFLCQFL